MRHLTHWELRSAQWRCWDGRSAGFNRFTEYIPPKETGWCGMDLILIGSLVSDQSPPRCRRLHSAILASGLETRMMMNTSSDPVTRPRPPGPPTFSRETKIRDWCSSWAVTELPPPSRCKISCQLSEYYPARDLFVWPGEPVTDPGHRCAPPLRPRM